MRTVPSEWWSSVDVEALSCFVIVDFAENARGMRWKTRWKIVRLRFENRLAQNGKSFGLDLKIVRLRLKQPSPDDRGRLFIVLFFSVLFYEFAFLLQCVP